MADVFISYSRSDILKVKSIADKLDELFVGVWYDPNISSGERFWDVITQEIDSAKVVIVCWSQPAVDSQYVNAEAIYAREKILPIMLSPCKLKPPFNHIQAPSLENWDGSQNAHIWQQFLKKIGTKIGRNGLHEAAAVFALQDHDYLYRFALTYPSDPFAQNIWKNSESEYRKDFSNLLVSAKTEANKIVDNAKKRYLELLGALPSRFESWLDDERNGRDPGPMPNPIDEISATYNSSEAIFERERIAEKLTESEAKRSDLELQLEQLRSEKEGISNSFAESTRINSEIVLKSKEIGDEKERISIILSEAKKNIAVLSSKLEVAELERQRLNRNSRWQRLYFFILLSLFAVACVGAYQINDSKSKALIADEKAASDEAEQLLSSRVEIQKLKYQLADSAASVDRLTGALNQSNAKTAKLQSDIDAIINKGKPVAVAKTFMAVSTDQMFLRSAPDPISSAVVVLNRGVQVEIISTDPNGWANVTIQDHGKVLRGYLNTKYLIYDLSLIPVPQVISEPTDLGSPPVASFCGRTSDHVQTFICADSTLSETESYMEKSFHALLSLLNNSPDLLASQTRWEGYRKISCGISASLPIMGPSQSEIKDCLKALIEDRKHALRIGIY